MADTHDLEKRREMLRLVAQEGFSLTKAAKSVKLPVTTAYRWLVEDMETAISGHSSQTSQTDNWAKGIAALEQAELWAIEYLVKSGEALTKLAEHAASDAFRSKLTAEGLSSVVRTLGETNAAVSAAYAQARASDPDGPGSRVATAS